MQKGFCNEFFPMVSSSSDVHEDKPGESLIFVGEMAL